MGDALMLLAMFVIGTWVGYNVALTEGQDFRDRVRRFFGLTRLGS